MTESKLTSQAVLSTYRIKFERIMLKKVLFEILDSAIP
jgi:hypothetical protein